MKNPVDPQIEFLKDVQLTFSVKVGTINKLLIEILTLKEGDVIELNKSVEEYVSIELNKKLFAIGEMVIANEKYGVRIVDLA